jgi:hypothetical protein
MKMNHKELISGSKNMFRDLGKQHADIQQLTVDRLKTVINRLGSRIEVYVKVKRSKTAA